MSKPSFWKNKKIFLIVICLIFIGHAKRKVEEGFLHFFTISVGIAITLNILTS